MHPSTSVLLQSNMILFQSSPVETANMRMKADVKSPKFLRLPITSPSVTSPNQKLPDTANMKKISMSRPNTLARDGIENMIVWIIAYNPAANLRSLVTLSTLNTLASCGRALTLSRAYESNALSTKSIKDEATTKKSNLFHEFSK